MQVILKRNWFVGGNHYRKLGKSPVEIPDKYRNILPKGAVVVGDLKVPVEDAPEKDPKVPEVISRAMFKDALEKEEPYVNPAHALDPERQFAEAFSEVNKDAKKEVDDLRDKFKNPNQGK